MSEQDLRNILSVNLRKYRNHLNYTQAEFAKKVDISIPFLSDIENGKKWVSPATLTNMARALDIEVYELLKPDEKLPDNAVHIIRNYTSDINTAFGETLKTLCAEYISNLEKAM